MNHFIKYRYFVFCFWLMSLSAIGQLNWEKPLVYIDSKKDLPSAYVQKVIQDKEGFIWVATYTGVVRYDGENIEAIQDTILPAHGFLDIALDEKRNLVWIAAVSGVYAYNMLSKQVTRIDAPEMKSLRFVLCIAPDHHERLWVGGGLGFGYIDLEDMSFHVVITDNFGDRPSPTSEPIKVNAIAVTDSLSEDVYLGTPGGLLRYNFNTEVLELVSLKINNNKAGVHNILYDKYSNGLFIDQTEGNNNQYQPSVIHYDLNTDEVIKEIIMEEGWVSSQFQVLNDTAVLLSSSNDILKYHKNSKNLVPLFDRKPKDEVKKLLYYGNDGLIWTTSPLSIEAFEIEQDPVTSYFYETPHPGWRHIASYVYVDDKDQKVYMTEYGGEGLYTFDLNTFKWSTTSIYDSKGEVKRSTFSEIAVSQDGVLRIAGRSGLYTKKGDVLEKTSSELLDKRIQSQSLLESEFLWSASEKGLYRVNLITGESEEFYDKVYPCRGQLATPEFIEDSRKNIWISGFCENFHFYNKKTSTLTEFEFDQVFDPSYTVNFIEKDEEMWVITRGLLFGVINVEDPSKGLHTTIDLKSLMANDEVEFINTPSVAAESCSYAEFDHNGYLWIISDIGLLKFDPENLTIELFDENNGLILKDPDLKVFVANNLHCLADGRMVYSTRKGITIFDPVAISNNSRPPKAYISSFRVNEQDYVIDTTSLSQKRVILKPYENYIGINMASISYGVDAKQYRYRLVGLNDKWKNPGDRTYVSFTNLSGGDYTFEMNVGDAKGEWSPIIERFDITIEKYWYEEDWFRGLLAASVIYLFLFYYFSRLNRAIKEEQIKTKHERDLAELKMQALTAQMNPHFIFNSLNSIDFYIIKNDSKNASEYLNRFSRLMRLILKNSRQKSITLKQEVETLKLYLEIESLRFNHRFSYEIIVDDSIDTEYVQIPPMLLQPYIENSIWHGLLHKKDDGKITIKLSLDEEGEVLSCIIKDNGIGRRASMEMKAQNAREKERKSFGMNITKDKIEVLNQIHGLDASVNIVDLYDQDDQPIGTQAEININV